MRGRLHGDGGILQQAAVHRLDVIVRGAELMVLRSTGAACGAGAGAGGCGGGDGSGVGSGSRGRAVAYGGLRMRMEEEEENTRSVSSVVLDNIGVGEWVVCWVGGSSRFCVCAEGR